MISRASVKRGSTIPLQNIINVPNIKYSHNLGNGIFFWVQNDNDIEKICLACGSPISSAQQSFCDDRCDSYHFSHKGGWIYRTKNILPTGLCKQNRLLQNMLKYFETSAKQLFSETLKLIGYLISTALFSLHFKQSHSVSTCLTNSFGEFFEMFYHPALEFDLKDFSINDSVSESYSLIYAALCFEQYPPADIFCSASESDEIFLEHYICEIKSFFSLSIWIKCLQIMDCFGLNIYIESEFLKSTQKLPTLQSFEDRRNALFEKYSAFIQPAEQFLRQNGTFECATSSVDEFENDAALIKIDRAISRIGQAAELANKANSPFGNHRIANCGVSNPFDGYGYVLTVLSPFIVPFYYQTEDIGDRFNSNCCVRLEQSCLENVHVEIVFSRDDDEKLTSNERSCPLRLQIIANNNIEENSMLTYNYSKSAEFTVGNAVIGKTTILSCGSTLKPRETSVPCLCMKCMIDSDLEGGLQFMGIDICYVSSLLARSVSNPRNKRKIFELFDNKSSSRSDIEFEYSINFISNAKVVHSVLRDLVEKVSRSLLVDQPLNFDGEKCAKLQKLALVANSYMQQQKVGVATVLYSLIVLQLLRESQTSSESSSDSQAVDWIGDVCLSLGYIGFEALLSSHSNTAPQRSVDDSPWCIKSVTEIYQIGAKLSPNHSAISETVKKMNCYSVLQSDISSSHELKQYPFQSIIPQKIYSSSSSILSPQECSSLISAAEHYAEQTIGGWSTSRHYTVPTTDIPLHQLPSTVSSWFLEEVMVQRLSPLLQMQFFPYPEIEKLQIFLNDCFVVKYCVADEGPSQRYLPLHSDQSTHSLTIALNEDDEYVGGGTFFTELDNVVRPS